MGRINNVMLNAAEKTLELDRRRDRVMKAWLSAFSVDEIAAAEKVTRQAIILDLNTRRTELREFQDQEIHELAAERIEGLRLIQRDAILHQQLFPRGAAPLLTVRLRAEETIAKIQGVLNEKVVHLGRIIHHVKMYDFEDNFPTSGDNDDDSIIDSTGVVIEEPEVGEPSLQQLIPIIPSYIDGANVAFTSGGADEGDEQPIDLDSNAIVILTQPMPSDSVDKDKDKSPEVVSEQLEDILPKIRTSVGGILDIL